MKRLLLVAPILVVVSAGLAAAEDHLVCYKVRDPRVVEVTTLFCPAANPCP
jgi:hypothetical protein